MKTCSRCHVEKEFSEFTKNPRYRDGHQSYCRACVTEYGRLRFYGLSVAEYEAMLAAQDDACAICGDIFTATPHVDHCHDTKEVRGLLCFNCNRGIGCFHDSVTKLEAAIQYLS